MSVCLFVCVFTDKKQTKKETRLKTNQTKKEKKETRQTNYKLALPRLPRESGQQKKNNRQTQHIPRLLRSTLIRFAPPLPVPRYDDHFTNLEPPPANDVRHAIKVDQMDKTRSNGYTFHTPSVGAFTLPVQNTHTHLHALMYSCT